ncbi:alkene reductase [Frondihabitans australicus]|uniref:N-ethylmaleimide reductase n=1 Tax=Frondihabitans australicus TaxID=386892 RepID=A0A495IIP8_9MICO|nr:alkene reductase [Frondihabitans australicus]RKR75864.1 N-ethylmaleimide reductase [Frondihabitans australicus]
MERPTTSHLFTSLTLGERTLANRVVMAPMTRARTTNAASAPTQIHETYYGQRAGAGMIVSEGLAVSRDAIGGINLPGLFSHEQVAGWSSVTDAVHGTGSALIAQLVHVGAMSHRDLLGGRLPLAPSSINPAGKVSTASGRVSTESPRAMSVDDIERTIADYASAARNAMRAGFDGVEIHAHRGYLISQFANPRSNRRTDGYGGDVKARSRFFLEVVRAVSESIGTGILGIKIAPYWTEGEAHVFDDDSSAAYDYALTEVGKTVSYVHAMAPRTSAWADFVAEDRTALLQRVRSKFDGTVIANGGFNAESAEAVLDAGFADAVSFGLPFVANPDLPRRLALGLPWADPDRSSMYVGGTAGYIDYPTATIADPLAAADH